MQYKTQKSVDYFMEEQNNSSVPQLIVDHFFIFHLILINSILCFRANPFVNKKQKAITIPYSITIKHLFRMVDTVLHMLLGSSTCQNIFYISNWSLMKSIFMLSCALCIIGQQKCLRKSSRDLFGTDWRISL